jgi:hypothetical protein
MDVAASQLTGNIPVEMGNLINLRGLFLSSNLLSGAIPAAIGNLVNLQTLYLSNNGLDCSADFVAGLVSIRNLRVQFNGWTQTESNQFVQDMYASALTRTYAGGIVVQMHGSNAAPSGTYQSPTVCPPVSEKEMVYDMVNDFCATGINPHVWTMN